MHRRLALAAFALACAWAAPAHAGEKKIRVVIIDGQNNHNWKDTSPHLKKVLEETGKFSADIATTPQVPSLPQPKKPKDEKDERAIAKYREELAKYEAALPKFREEEKAAREAFAKWRVDFDKYDVVLSNYNGAPWPKEVNDAFEQRLREGKLGLVIIHAANNSFGGWKEFVQMVGMGWYDKSKGDRLYLDDAGKEIKVPAGQGDGPGHRYTGPFTVTLRDDAHPVTKGMPKEWLHANDELYDNMRGPIQNIHLLATAYSKGTKVHEPMIWTVSYGKGRVFHTPMGHVMGNNLIAMQCVGFIATVQRGTEWAATGTVTLPLPADFPTASKMSVVK